MVSWTEYVADYICETTPQYLLLQADCFEWLAQIPENSIHAIVTDPPFAVKEFDPEQLRKRAENHGGIWRIPPSFDGAKRQPMPRFTDLTAKDIHRLRAFYAEWARLCLPPLRPGAHVFVACNALLAQDVFEAMRTGGLEYRGQIVRLVRTFRGGDRPKGAEQEFSNTCTMPRSCFEPWGLFRKALPRKMTVAECLREWGTGALRRKPDGNPLEDVIQSERTSQRERNIIQHPSLKPQRFLRQIVHAAVPTDHGILLDPFMGSGSTIAAAKAQGLISIGIERQMDFFDGACNAVPLLAAV